MSEDWKEEHEDRTRAEKKYNIPEGHRVFVEPTYDDPAEEREHLEGEYRKLHEDKIEFYQEALNAFEVILYFCNDLQKLIKNLDSIFFLLDMLLTRKQYQV